MSVRLHPPRDLRELSERAAALCGRSIADLERELESESRGPMVGRKGKTGQLIERALGADAGSQGLPDFVALGVELKTLPLDQRGRSIESTFVCALSLRDAEMADWRSSGVRRKLSHVLFVPVLSSAPKRPDVAAHRADRQIGEPFFWRPTDEQESVLRADFDDLMGMIALGRIEDLHAGLGRWLQIRPKAAHGGVRTRAHGLDDEPVSTIPRGFYLRARFTSSLARPRTRFDARLLHDRASRDV